MAPRLLDNNQKQFRGNHADNCRKALAQLLDLNPGYNVFVYWSKVQKASSDLVDWNVGEFHSREDAILAYNYSYSYFVFQEGTITWDGSTTDDKLLITKDNYDLVDWQYRFQKRDRKYVCLPAHESDFLSVTFPAALRRMMLTPFNRKVDWSNWMRQLREELGPRQNELYLSSLALPGTHNSHALAQNIIKTSSFFALLGLGVATCQTATIREQLDMGVRSIDLRVGKDNTLRHGKVQLTGKLDDVLGEMDHFLADHPSETILFQAKWDDEPYSEDNKAMAAKNVVAALGKYRRAMVQGTQPKLSECVGKMVWYSDDSLGGTWAPMLADPGKITNQGSGDVEIQASRVKQQAAAFLDHLDIKDGKYCDIWVSSQTLDNWNNWVKVITGQLEVTRPGVMAAYVNPKMYEWLSQNRRGRQDRQARKGRLGRVIVDYAEYTLVHEVVQWNFDGGFL
ncbi:hypothetical protein MMC18_000715 [Xylographa bjoerkii]|nr:hypothetical protein [Xylographa bjoerkii]